MDFYSIQLILKGECSLSQLQEVEIHKAGNAEGLIDWYNNGAGGQIDWGSEGDFQQCVAIAGKYLDNPEGFCQLRHIDATGELAGKAPGEVTKADQPDYTGVISDRKGEPDDQDLYNRVKREAKKKFDVYPSAVANGWVVQEYKRRGGTYSKPVEKAETYTPPKGVQSAAQRALQWLAEGRAGDGFTPVGRKRASDLAHGHAVSIDTLKRMKAYFDRHAVDKKAQGFTKNEEGYPSHGRVAWDAWGGDAGYAWARSIVGRVVEKGDVPGHDFHGNQWTDGHAATTSGKNEFVKLTSTKIAKDDGPLKGAENGAVNSGIRVVTLEDGSKAVIKDCTPPKDMQEEFGDGKDLANREVLAARVGEALGSPIRDCVHVPGSETEVMSPLVEGKTFDETGADASDSLKFFDQVVDNYDRNPGNGFTSADGKEVGIDHGAALETSDYKATENPDFSLIKATPEGISAMTDQLQALKPEFAAAGMTDHFNLMMDGWNTGAMNYAMQQGWPDDVFSKK